MVKDLGMVVLLLCKVNGTIVNLVCDFVLGRLKTAITCVEKVVKEAFSAEVIIREKIVVWLVQEQSGKAQTENVVFLADLAITVSLGEILIIYLLVSDRNAAGIIDLPEPSVKVPIQGPARGD